MTLTFKEEATSLGNKIYENELHLAAQNGKAFGTYHVLNSL